MNAEQPPHVNAAAKLPPIAQSMLDLLSDGEAHSIDELKELVDEEASNSNVQTHLNVVRRHLLPMRASILCSFGPGRWRTGDVTYRLVKYAKGYHNGAVQ